MYFVSFHILVVIFDDILSIYLIVSHLIRSDELIKTGHRITCTCITVPLNQKLSLKDEG